ncbi:SDR family NAD(P)-dependent oxidoreductase [Croceicoccus mobilis]|uniref:3-hydroxyacyl-CoA dehydrogenase n=1 Tax=Croceicoccus mobilis TaxID=1703339 RepID=A0A916Z7Y2_9SPHN|nr:SDR family NAD(P)-dependent oxidoreductase [Croceicoccus mobilis]GGD80554.1 3-hydroxyacyl-CoA dehydrogenase [Croceicoccus mobilis]
MLESLDLSGRHALVTGGGTGIGLAMATALASHDAAVMLAGRRAEVLDKAADLIRKRCPGAAVSCQTADLYDAASVEALGRNALDALGHVDIFLGNAGALHFEPADAITLAEAERCLRVNLTANMMLVQQMLPGMRQRGYGRILFSSSTASRSVATGQCNVAYSAAKAGLNAYARSLAAEFGRDGVTANVLLLGVIWTEILHKAVADLKAGQGDAAADALTAGFEAMTATGRLGEPGDIAGIAALLASPAGAHVTGAEIPVDGGNAIMMMPFTR